jgi:hypothetical protein
MSAEVHLELHPLTYVEEPDGVTVGRADIDSYAVLPGEGAALLKRLGDGMSVQDAADWYAATFGEPVDMADFVTTLRELGFVKVNGEDQVVPTTVRSRTLGRLAFSPVAWVCYGTIVAACLLVMALHPQLRPQAQHMFFVPSLILVQLLLAVVQFPALLWHEWFHVLAGRRLGLSARLTVGRRMYFFVFLTELNGLLGVPRKQRYLPFLSGMLADVLLFSTLTLVAAVDRTGWVAPFALAVSYTVLLRLAWQFCVFLRTDLYYVLATMLGCTNLHEVTSAYLRDRFGWLPGVGRSTVDRSEWTPRDLRAAPWFAGLTVVGVAFLLATAVLFVTPVVVEFATRLWSALTQGSAGGALFWDSAVSMVLISLELVVLPFIAGRHEKGVPA